jgi:ATP-dependent protease ClpP protease subunit
MQGEIDIVGEITESSFIKLAADLNPLRGKVTGLTVNIDSPGGLEKISDDMAKEIRDMAVPITTVQTGIIASAAVKLFLEGQVRERNSAYPFLIHNTHIDPANIPMNIDANVAVKLANVLTESRMQLATYYSEKTGANVASILGVMNMDTPMSAEDSIKLNFATKITNEIPILAKLNMIKIQESIEKIKANLAPVAPAPAPTPTPIVAAYKVGDTAGDLKEGENPQPDGSVVIVEAGVVKEIKPKMEDVQAAKLSALEASVTAIAEQVASLSGMVKAKLDSEKELKASIDAELVNIKNQIKGKHTPATKGINEPGKLSPADEYRKRK